ncbi:MAG TPA: hypothetical protein VGF99_16880 [Myxococcota bacterium]
MVLMVILLGALVALLARGELAQSTSQTLLSQHVDDDAVSAFAD